MSLALLLKIGVWVNYAPTRWRTLSDFKMSRSYYDARLYLQDTNLTTISSNEQLDLILVKCEKLEVVGGKFGPSTHKVILNKTIFHPQG